MSIEIMKQALEAMEYADACLKKQLTTKTKHEYAQDLLMDAGVALRQAIEQAEKQEPVCDTDPRGCWSVRCQLGNKCKNTPAPQREWVGLTDGEWVNIVNKNQAWFGMRPDDVAHEVCKLTEAKLKEKNT
jgi:ABC-type dipeptide/oligopeptide/nickel transport system ATPase component